MPLVGISLFSILAQVVVGGAKFHILCSAESWCWCMINKINLLPCLLIVVGHTLGIVKVY